VSLSLLLLPPLLFLLLPPLLFLLLPSSLSSLRSSLLYLRPLFVPFPLPPGLYSLPAAPSPSPRSLLSPQLPADAVDIAAATCCCCYMLLLLLLLQLLLVGDGVVMVLVQLQLRLKGRPWLANDISVWPR
jgi:hypothetical protein